MLTRLEQFGHVQTFVVGPRGEGSDDLIALLKRITQIAAERNWRHIGADSVTKAAAVIGRRFLRSLGIAAVRAAATLKRERLSTLLGGWDAAAARRSFAKKRHRDMRDEYVASFGNDRHYDA